MNRTPSDQVVKRWDAFDGYLCDIDGTLMRCSDLVHYTAFNRALSAIAGREITIDGVVTEGNVDLGILRDAFAKHGVEEHLWAPRREWAVAEMGRWVNAYAQDLRFSVLPGVRELLNHLKRRGALLSTATGNFAAIGKVKLAQAGLLDMFELGGWSDGCETRTAVFRKAATALRAQLGADAELCVLGDTPADVRAAKDCGLRVIAVASGIFDMEQLKAEQPDYLARSALELLQSVTTEEMCVGK